MKKNEALQLVRESSNFRLDSREKSRRQNVERKFNSACQMEQSTHIEQIMANAKPAKAQIPMYKITEEQIGNFIRKRREMEETKIEEPMQRSIHVYGLSNKYNAARFYKQKAENGVKLQEIPEINE